MSTEPVWPERYGRIELGEVDSTNAEGLRRAGELKRPTWILARHQTRARGRGGRSWANPPGNFSATLMMRPGGETAWAALRSFLAGNALFETLALYADRTDLSLKWPNDILYRGGKVGGILLETTGGATVDWLAIGIGVNLRHAPTDVGDDRFPPVSLAGEGGDFPEPEDFLTTLAGFYATEEDILDEMGFEPIRESWLTHAARLGEIITARTGREEITGRFETIDDQGHLILRTEAGGHAIPAADVYF